MAPREKHKQVTAADLARRLRMSPATVSFVLNGKTEEHRISAATADRVRREAARLNYHPSPIARQLAGMRSNAVGVLVHTEAVADPRMIQKMEVQAAQRGIRFIVGHAVGTPVQVKAYLDDFRARGVDAIISIFHNHPDYRDVVLAELADFQRVVYYEKPIGPASLVSQACYVTPDYYAVGQLGFRHLQQRGKRRVGLVLCDRVFSYAQNRWRAYRDAIKDVGLRFEPRLTWVMDQQPGTRWTQSFTAAHAAQVVEQLVVQQGADGLLAVNDIYAARLVAALHRRGLRVPQDVAVVGCNDEEIGTVTEPQLTTIDLHIDELAQQMIRVLFALLDADPASAVPQAVVVRPDLIVRDST
jgi:DNA-binding LacI/PurR family transcriptional regulator